MAVGTSLKPNPGIRGEGLRFDGTQHVEHPAAEVSLDGPWTFGLWVMSENSLGCALSKIEPTNDRRGLEVLWQKGRLGVNLVDRWGASGLEILSREKLPTNEWRHVVVRYDGSRRAEGLRLFVNGRIVPVEVRRNTLSGTLQNTEPLRLARRDQGLGFYGSLDEFRWLPGRWLMARWRIGTGANASEALSNGPRTNAPAGRSIGCSTITSITGRTTRRAVLETRSGKPAPRKRRCATRFRRRW